MGKIEELWSRGGKFKHKLVPPWHYGKSYKNGTGKTKQKLRRTSVDHKTFLWQLCFKSKPSDMNKFCASYRYSTPPMVFKLVGK